MTITFGWLGFGVILDPSCSFPWTDYGEIENWWISEICGFRPTTPLYAKDGSLLQEDTSEEAQAHYLEEEDTFMQTQPPLLIDCVWCGEPDRPLYALLVTKTNVGARPGQPVRINPTELRTTKSTVDTVMNFCARFGLRIDRGPAWFLLGDEVSNNKKG